MTLFEVITAAVNDVVARGYVSAEQIAEWLRRIRQAATEQLIDEKAMQNQLIDALQSAHDRFANGGDLKLHPGVSRFTLEMVKPKLRNALDRSIYASTDLIKLNRAQAIDKTLQRFSGWATSIPPGGSNTTARAETKQAITKSMRSLPFEERRVIIDQSAKFTANLSRILATDGGALACRWHSRWRVPGYDYREDHKDRDGLVYALKGSWAIEKGLMKKGPAGYYEDITAVAEEPFCRCSAVWIYNLGSLPDDMLTIKGRAALAAAREKVGAM